jgi:hypothetical protein
MKTRFAYLCGFASLREMQPSRKDAKTQSNAKRTMEAEWRN